MTTRKSVRYKLPVHVFINGQHCPVIDFSRTGAGLIKDDFNAEINAEAEIIVVFPHKSGNEGWGINGKIVRVDEKNNCLLYTSPSPRDLSTSRMPSSA